MLRWWKDVVVAVLEDALGWDYKKDNTCVSLAWKGAGWGRARLDEAVVIERLMEL